MSDVHCPATILLTAPGEVADAGDVPALGVAGRRQVAQLADSLRDRRLAMVHSAPEVPAVQTAEVVAAALGLHVQVWTVLGGSAGTTADVAAELEEIGDGHRGEAVLVVLPRQVLGAVVPFLAAGAAVPAGNGPVELAVDADGWVLRSWVEEPVGAPYDAVT